MRKIKGSNLVEYVIPIATIALVAGLGIYFLFSSGSILSFTANSSNMEVKATQQKGIIDPNPPVPPLLNPAAGSLGGTLENPVQQCVDGVCVIDYGDFILTNIPEDFNDFVQTSGTAGGFKEMANYLDKVAKDLHKGGHFDLASEIQRLANLGHNIALIMEEYERIFNLCNGNSTCISSYDNQPFPIPDGFNDSEFSIPQGATYSELLDSGAFGAVKNGTNVSPLASAYMNQFKKIMNSGSTKGEVKGVIRELTWNIGTVGQDFYSNYSYATGSTVDYYDPLTGQSSAYINTYNDPYTNFTNYNASRITNFNSSLICSVGYGNDTGITCH